MSDNLYRPLTEGMTWSYSRVTLFSQCPYAWYMKYIRRMHEEPNFYSSYGSFMHKIIEGYYKGNLTKEQMKGVFLSKFSQAVKGKRPNAQTLTGYIQDGISYLDGFKPFDMKTVGVEKRVRFEIEGKKFVGVIDYLGEKDGSLIIIDHKSRKLRKPKRKTANSASQAEIDSYMRQLYLYAEAVKQEYGVLPDKLCINCFRNGNFIEEPFDKSVFDRTKQWVLDEISYIEGENEFPPFPDWFYCKNLCGYSGECCYFDMI